MWSDYDENSPSISARVTTASMVVWILAQIVLIILKLFGIINWGWLEVLAPLLFLVGIVVIGLLLYLIAKGILYIIGY